MTLIDKIAWIELADGKILSTRSRGKDVYYLPGGKREPGESDIDALVRELREELGSEADLRLNRMGGGCIYLLKACRSDGRRIHLLVSEEDEEICDVYCCCYP